MSDVLSGNAKDAECVATKRGLVLTGGGARSAYQVGVLKAISEQFPDLEYPFNNICGTSAGAINAVGLASFGRIFRHSVEQLEALWAELNSESVFRTDLWGMTRRMGHFLKSVMAGNEKKMPASLLDNSPLRDFLNNHIEFSKIQESLRDGCMDSICLTACGYRSGQSVSFFQGKDYLKDWHLGQRLGVKANITIDHLMATTAIPTLFPPVKIHREYFGDGVVRNMAPLSPAIHLGSERILIIGVSANRVCAPVRKTQRQFPKLTNIMEHVLNGAFIDVIENDVDKALLVNTLLKLVPADAEEHALAGLRPLDILNISPSEPIDNIATKHIDSLPATVRKFLGESDPNVEGGASLISYLMFEAPFMRDLIRLGYRDAQTHARQIEQFFS